MKRCTIIAEAGVNHNGHIKLAVRLVEAAAKAGADYVKFQTYKSEQIVTAGTPKAAYQKSVTGEEETMLDMLKRLELPFESFRQLKEVCDKVGIGFLSTPSDIESAHFLFSLGLGAIKVSSGEITNLPLLEVIADVPCKVFLSTGMCEPEEIGAAIAVLQKKGKTAITLLQCNTQYPTPMCDVNLRAMQTLKDMFCLPVGLSDHSLGIEVPVAAAAMGAAVVEKHFTLSRELEGPDHQASLEPCELCEMVRAIRNVELALGDGVKRVTASERENRELVRKSIVAAANIKKGELFTTGNLAAKCPGTGLSPMRWYDVLGKTASHDFVKDEMIVLLIGRDTQ